MQDPIKANPVNVAYLRHIDEVKPLSGEKKDINIFSDTDSIFASNYFKKLGRHFKTFFEAKPSVQVIYITNEKKDREGRNIYFMAITKKELIYEEEQDKKLLRLMYLFEFDEIKTNQGVVYSVQAKQKFKKKLKQIGRDIQNKHAYVFEA